MNEYSVPQLISTCKVLVNVLDMNDNAPVFEQSIYYATVFENSPVNTSIIQVRAHDQDIVSTYYIVILKLKNLKRLN